MLQNPLTTEDNSGQKSILDLPTEILAHILGHTTKARFTASQTCRCLASIVHDIIGYKNVAISTIKALAGVII